MGKGRLGYARQERQIFFKEFPGNTIFIVTIKLVNIQKL